MREKLKWAATAVGPGARVIDVHALHEGQGPWRLGVEYGTRRVECVLRAPTPRIGAAMVRTGAAALELAEQHGLPAPRLIAADLADVPMTLETLAAGTIAWPPPPTVERLRAAGAALARVHRIAMGPREYLPFRPRPIAVDDFAADRRTARMPTTPLLQEADVQVTAHGLPSGESVFVHGDVWPGNMVWSGGTPTALIDWKTAGVGAPGVDVSELRKQVAITFGPEAPAHVLAGWEYEAGAKAPDVGYWDAVAALNTPTELWGEGEAIARRDAFLRQALRGLG
jgi:aminoglycoside phosphotransferase (APT) family kinase protein